VDVYGPWEHPRAPLSSWCSAVETRTPAYPEYPGRGMLFAGDVAEDIVRVASSFSGFARWEVCHCVTIAVRHLADWPHDWFPFWLQLTGSSLFAVVSCVSTF
jgi:hypothetical protein